MTVLKNDGDRKGRIRGFVGPVSSKKNLKLWQYHDRAGHGDLERKLFIPAPESRSQLSLYAPEMVVKHWGHRAPAEYFSDSNSIYDSVMNSSRRPDVVLINNAQQLDSGIIGVAREFVENGIDVVYTLRNLTSEGIPEMFSDGKTNVGSLMANTDYVHSLEAICEKCGDEHATKSQWNHWKYGLKEFASSDLRLDPDHYIPVCNDCFVPSLPKSEVGLAGYVAKSYGELVFHGGGMYSGKSSSNSEDIPGHEKVGRVVLTFKKGEDDRYGSNSQGYCISHSGMHVPVIGYSNSSDILGFVEKFHTETGKIPYRVNISEPNFADSGMIDVVQYFIKNGINVGVDALPLFSENSEFYFVEDPKEIAGQRGIGYLMAMADKVDIHTSICKSCKQDDGTKSQWNYKKYGDKTAPKVIGGGNNDMYVSSCPDCLDLNYKY